LTTKDGGANWTIVEAKEAKDLSPVFFTSPHHGCGVDNNNSILCTNDGETWQVVYSDRGDRKVKTAMFFASEKQGWVVGQGIWHTSDGGETWRKQLSISDASHELRSVLFVDDQLGWAQSLDAVWRTHDAGKTWAKMSDTWMKYLNTRGSDASARRFNVTLPTPESRNANAHSAVGFLTPESTAAAKHMLTGQEPAKCKHEASGSAPSYRVGWTSYSVEGPKTLFLAISIDPHSFSGAELAALARRVKADYCLERRLVVSILDNYDVARAFAPTTEKVWFQKYWRGIYFLDLPSGEEWIEFSTRPERPRDEVRISLGLSQNGPTGAGSTSKSRLMSASAHSSKSAGLPHRKYLYAYR